MPPEFTGNDDNPRRDVQRQLAGLLRLIKWAVAGFLVLMLAALFLPFCLGLIGVGLALGQ